MINERQLHIEIKRSNVFVVQFSLQNSMILRIERNLLVNLNSRRQGLTRKKDGFTWKYQRCYNAMHGPWRSINAAERGILIVNSVTSGVINKAMVVLWTSSSWAHLDFSPSLPLSVLERSRCHQLTSTSWLLLNNK